MIGSRTSLRVLALMSAGGAALCLPASVQAQPAGSKERDEEVIVVTAQKREEILQDVPIAITVVDGEGLLDTGAAQLTDYGAYVPGMHVESGGTPGQATISLRGIAPIGPSATVGLYVDDAPIGASGIYARSDSFALDLLPYDIDRIEILRGPQGTLYGASSIGGLLRYVTVAPSLREFSGRVGAELFDIRHGTDVGFAGRAMINAPLVPDKVGVVASYAYRESPGYVDGATSGKRDQDDYTQEGARISLLARPVDDLSIRLSGLWQTIRSEGNANVVEDLATRRRIGDGLSNNNYIDEPFDSEFYYLAGTLVYDFGFAEATSATTYSRQKTNQIFDGSRTFGVLFPFFEAPAGLAPFTLRLDLKKFTQELRLTSPSGGRFEWLIGGFYTHEKSANRQTINARLFDGTAIPGLDPLAIASLPSRYQEFAIFGNATFKFNDHFDVTGGLRWATNDQTFRQISGGIIVPTDDIPGTSQEDVLTYSISPRIHVNEDTMIYGRVASGYRPGGPNVNLPGVPPIVKSDSLVNYEVGLKSILFDRALSIEAAIFYMDWKDIQLTLDRNGVNYLANAGSAVTKGIEGSVIWRPVRGLRLGVNGAYTDAKLTEDAPSLGGDDGDRLASVPDWSWSATADYGFAVGTNARIDLGAGIRHVGGRISEVEGSEDSIAAAPYTALDLNAEVTFNERWSLRLYARNVTDSDGAISRNRISDGIGRPSYIRIVPLQPRTIGVALDLAF